MNLANLRAFVAVAEAGSVNRAALRLNLTQPAVTRRVQNFEAAMGSAVLLDRSSKPHVLTAAGRQALEHCRRVIVAVGELEDCASEASQPDGELRIGMPHGLAEFVVTSPLDDLRRTFPNLRLRVSAHWTNRLVEEVSNGGLDCAVALLTEHQAIPPRITSVRLGSDRVVIVAPRTLKVTRKGRRLSIRDLGECEWVVNTAGCGYRLALERAFDRAQVTMRIMGEILGYDLQLSMIARGAGLGLIPSRRLNSSSLRKHLRVLQVEDFALDATAVLLRGPSVGNLGIAIDSLQEKIADQLRK